LSKKPKPPRDDARRALRLYATLHPVGLWSEPCVIKCSCGFEARAPDCATAQQLAHAHDRTHDPALPE